EALTEMMDRIVPCSNPACEQKFFVAPDVPPLICPLCKTRFTAFSQLPYLKLRAPRAARGGGIEYVDETASFQGVAYNRYVVGYPTRPLYNWHADPNISLRVGQSGARTDAHYRATIRYDRARDEWFLENTALPDLQARIGGGEPASGGWTPVPLGKRVALRANTQLLLGQLNKDRVAYVEMKPL
ncbi:MAG TPA: hypothetical protein VKQ36_16355, partial [Ktedonobacterales bacterium]|nr:hypothetical protein [Ktedonobacterales bacterium]